MTRADSSMMPNDRLTVLTANLFNDHADTAELERVIQRERPDLVATQELGPKAARVLEKHYDHGLLRPQTDFNGIGLAAAFEIVAEELGTPHPRAITAVATMGSSSRHSMQFMSVRLPPPFFGTWVAERRRYAETLIDHVRIHQGPLCLLGDLNATPLWATYRVLRRELQDGARRARRLIFPRGATWPAPFPLLRIDHVLVRGLTVTRVKTLSIKGTDHRALLAELTIPSSAAGERRSSAT
jgi:vancomycin resistance protein VanJ